VSSDPWGRVDETGTVYVRTADGEQVVGSWQAGSPEEALAYFERKYEGLVVEIGLLEKRVKTTDLSAKDASVAIDHIREQVDAHHAVGDLDALKVRLDKLVETVDARREERKQQRAKQSDEARHAKEALVTEAEELAQSDQWRSAGERLRALVDTWKGLPRLDRKSRTPARRSPSVARPTSRSSTRSARTPARPRRSWSRRPRACRTRRTGVPRRRATAS
jgi:FtsZ-binding cell division protein ZapB